MYASVCVLTSLGDSCNTGHMALVPPPVQGHAQVTQGTDCPLRARYMAVRRDPISAPSGARAAGQAYGHAGQLYG